MIPIIKIARVKDIKTEDLETVKRAGIIAYTTYKNCVWFGLGIDRRSKDISDFGGKKERRDRTIFDTAIREFSEESLDIYGKLDRSKLDNCLAVYNQSSLIIFLNLKTKIKDAKKNFKKEVDTRKLKYVEMEDPIWIRKERFLDIIKHDKDAGLDKNRSNEMILYSKVRNMLIGCIDEISKITK